MRWVQARQAAASGEIALAAGAERVEAQARPTHSKGGSARARGFSRPSPAGGEQFIVHGIASHGRSLRRGSGPEPRWPGRSRLGLGQHARLGADVLADSAVTGRMRSSLSRASPTVIGAGLPASAFAAAGPSIATSITQASRNGSSLTPACAQITRLRLASSGSRSSAKNGLLGIPRRTLFSPQTDSMDSFAGTRQLSV